MKNILIFSILILFSGCADQKDPLPTLDEQLQGAWQYQWIEWTNRYNFHAGACDQYGIVPGQPVQYYSYVYTTSGDTLRMLNLGEKWGEVSECIVSFPSDSTAVFSWEGGVNYFLKRL